MPSKAKPIQMKTTYHVGGDTKAVPKSVDIDAANARYKFNAANKSAVNARNTFNAANKRAVGGMTPGDTGGQTTAPPALRRASQMQRMQRKRIKQMQRRAGKRSSPAGTTPPRNMAVRGPRPATGSRRRLGKKLSRFTF